MDDNFHYIAHWLGSLISTAAVVGVVTGVLPPLGALGALIWYYIQITESATYRRWKKNRTARKMAHLRSRLLELQAMSELEDETPER